MEFYLMRHAAAVEGAGIRWKHDSERPLSEDGIREMTLAARGLAAAGIGFDCIFSSPLVRAVQTARIVTEAQPEAVEAVELADLAPGLVPEELFSALRRANADGRVLLVGHEPDMGLLAARLLGLPPDRSILFRKGTVARIDTDGLSPFGSGSLVWLLTVRLAGSLSV